MDRMNGYEEGKTEFNTIFFAKMWMWMPCSNKGMTNIHHATQGRDKKLGDYMEKSNTWKRFFFEENDEYRSWN